MKKTCLFATALLITLTYGTAEAAEITVLAGMGNVSGIRDLAPAFEKASGHKVIVRFEQNADLARLVESNAQADVFTGNPQGIDEFITKGKIVAGTRVDFAKA